MATYRSIEKIVKAERVRMGHIYLDQAIPLRGMEQVDPFILIHHWADALKGGEKQEEVGVGPHPHRGFTPVTFIFNGSIHHRDSTGEDEVVHTGGTQWMHSGKGIVHSERPDKDLAEKGGEFEIIQFWVNVPANKKMVDPSYQPLTGDNTPWVISSDGNMSTGVIAGSFDGVKGPIRTESDLLILRHDARAGGEVEIDIPKTYNALIYQLDGELEINGEKKTSKKDMVIFGHDQERVHVKALADSKFITLSGAPIGEPLATYGPFVMNTEEELMQAMQDYQSGKMGTLVENFN